MFYPKKKYKSHRKLSATKYGSVLETMLEDDLRYERRKRDVMVRSIKISVVLLLVLTLMMMLVNWYFLG